MRKLRLYLAATALGAVLACNTPSVPLPPPELPSLGFLSAGLGEVQLTGKPDPAHASVRFYVYNLSRGDGVITTAAADGSFTTGAFAGGEGDTAQIYYDLPTGDRSQDVCVQIRLNAPLLSTVCN
jgi:hypothetical protein